MPLWEKNLKGPAYVFFYVFLFRKKNRAEILFFPFRWCALTGESGVFVSLVSSYIFISICRLMAFRQDVQRAVDRANENVSQPCVPRWARSVSARWKTRRRYRPTLCCAVSDWWLSVVALWLGLQWFITTAHNVIRLYIYIYIYIHSTNRSWLHCGMIPIFVCLYRHICLLSSYYHNVIESYLKRFRLKE